MHSIRITYYVHSTSEYNEQHKLGGWYDTKLSKLGKRQSIELRSLTKKKKFDAVFSSDLSRAYDTAKTAFGNRYRIIRDRRLRECNYGKMAGMDSSLVDKPKGRFKWLNKKFPNGESYKNVEKRIRSFIHYLKKNYDGKSIAIIAHQAPQLSFEVLLNHKTWKQAIETDWRRKGHAGWRPGWNYLIK